MDQARLKHTSKMWSCRPKPTSLGKTLPTRAVHRQKVKRTLIRGLASPPRAVRLSKTSTPRAQLKRCMKRTSLLLTKTLLKLLTRASTRRGKWSNTKMKARLKWSFSRAVKVWASYRFDSHPITWGMVRQSLAQTAKKCRPSSRRGQRRSRTNYNRHLRVWHRRVGLTSRTISQTQRTISPKSKYKSRAWAR